MNNRNIKFGNSLETIVIPYGKFGCGKTSLVAALCAYLNSEMQIQCTEEELGYKHYHDLLANVFDDKPVSITQEKGKDKIIQLIYSYGKNKSKKKSIYLIDISGERLITAFTKREGKKSNELDPLLNKLLSKTNKSNIFFINMISDDNADLSPLVQYNDFIHTIETLCRKEKKRILGSIILFTKQDYLNKKKKKYSQLKIKKKLKHDYPDLVNQMEKDIKQNRSGLNILFYDALSVGKRNGDRFTYNYDKESKVAFIGNKVLERAITYNNDMKLLNELLPTIGIITIIVIVFTSLIKFLIIDIYYYYEIVIFMIAFFAVIFSCTKLFTVERPK